MSDINEKTLENKNDRQDKKKRYETILRGIILGVVVLSIIVAIINEITFPSLSLSQEVIHWSYFLLESVSRTLLVYIGAIVTVKIIKLSKRDLTIFRKVSLVSFSLVMTTFLLIIPLLIGFLGFSYLLMPFPWSTIPFQIIETGSYFGYDFVAAFGKSGVTYALSFYLGFQGIIFLGVVLIGREWFCSMLCPLNGCHAATLGEVLPFRPHDKEKPNARKKPPKIVTSLHVLQWIFFPLHIGLTVFWGLYTTLGIHVLPISLLLSIELVKYLIFGLFLLMIGWIVIGGRSYCYYCPAGTFLGLVSRVSGQKIKTDITHCIECGSCNDACPMSIDIKSAAANEDPVKSINCIGCRSCVEACPKGTLQYSTPFLDVFN